jgi:sigma-B regulation protein RsbU (phosphoserine phosphatase)
MKTADVDERIKQLEQENIRLKKGIEELSILNEIALAISSTLSLDKIIELIIRKCVKHFTVEQASVLLLDKEDEDAPFHTMIRRADRSGYILPYRLDTQITGWMLKNQSALIINNFEQDKRFTIPDPEKFPVNSLLNVPLMLKGKMIGLICLFNKKETIGFTLDNQRLLSIIATESAQVIENARLYKEEQEYLSIREELRLASQIQLNLLPKKFPELPGYDIAAINLPAQQVSGDYYDFIPISETELAFCLGDVSGKGMPAALLMANLQATLRGQVFFKNSPKVCVTYSNSLLFNSTSSEKFVSLFYGKIDIKNHELLLCNAGHDRPLFLSKDNELFRLKTGGIVLGFIPDFQYEEEKRVIQAGEIILVYSDGITEAMNENEEEFGEERLIEILRENKDQSSERIIKKIIENVGNHFRGMPQMDDMTLLIIKRER